MKTDICAVSVPQSKRTHNEDHYVVKRDGFPVCAVADGAGAANQSAKRILSLFIKLHEDGPSKPSDLLRPETWKNWIKLLDSSLLGGPQSTFCAFTIGGIENEGQRRDIAVGACVGNTRLYLLDTTGSLTNVTAGAKKERIGSGSPEPLTFWIELRPGDMLMLLSDGAYSPMSFAELQRLSVGAKLKHLSEVPTAIVERASKYGLADDATVVALKCA